MLPCSKVHFLRLAWSIFIDSLLANICGVAGAGRAETGDIWEVNWFGTNGFTGFGAASFMKAGDAFNTAACGFGFAIGGTALPTPATTGDTGCIGVGFIGAAGG